MSDLEDRYNILKGKKLALQTSLQNKTNQVNTLESDAEIITKSRWVFTEVSRITQTQFKRKVETLVSLLLRSVFPERKLDFVLNFELKRSKFEVRILIKEDDQEFTPDSDMGGSVVDLISFGLRIVLWSLEKPRTRSLFVMDEPFKNLGEGMFLERAGRMVKELSDSMKLQIFIVSHKDSQVELSDKSWKVVMKDGKSSVEELI